MSVPLLTKQDEWKLLVEFIIETIPTLLSAIIFEFKFEHNSLIRTIIISLLIPVFTRIGRIGVKRFFIKYEKVKVGISVIRVIKNTLKKYGIYDHVENIEHDISSLDFSNVENTNPIYYKLTFNDKLIKKLPENKYTNLIKDKTFLIDEYENTIETEIKGSIVSLIQYLIKFKTTNSYRVMQSDKLITYRTMPNLTKSNIMLDLSSKIFTGIDNYNNNKNLDYFNKRCLSNKYVIMIFGPPGTGKTSIPMAISNEYNREMIHFEPKCSDFDWIGETINSYANTVFVLDEIDKMVDELNSNEYLVKDDKNNNSQTIKKAGDNFHLALMRILDRHYNTNPIIIITTNKRRSDFNPAFFRGGRINHFEEIGFISTYQFINLLEFYIDVDNYKYDPPKDFIFPEYQLSSADILHFCIVPNKNNPEKIFRAVLDYHHKIKNKLD